MKLRLLETGLSLLLAAAFALAGEAILSRRSTRFSSWVESFLVGAGVCAAALFPLSLALPGRALAALAALLGITAAGSLIGRIRTSNRSARPLERPRMLRGDLLSLAFLGVTVAAAVGFAALNWRYVYLWDGFQIWAARAQVLFHQGDLTPHLVPGDYFNAKLAYPPLVPMAEALLSLLRGGFDFDALKPVFAVFYLAMVVSTWTAARSAAGRAGGFAATALLCLLPAVSTGTAAGGYADMPQAAYVAAVAAAFLAKESEPEKERALPWLIGCLASVKSEGAILASVCLAAAAAAALARRRVAGRREAISFLAPPAILLGLRLAYVRWVDAGDTTYAGVDARSLGRALSRIPEVARLASSHLLDWRAWGLFWPAFLAAAIVLLAVGGSRGRIAAFACILALAADTSVFLFTNWPVALQIDQAYPRLLQQLAPAAAALVLAAYSTLRSRAAPPAAS